MALRAAALAHFWQIHTNEQFPRLLLILGEHRLYFYSNRKASVGCSAAARLAGTNPATMATPSKVKTATVRMNGSVADTPNKPLLISFAASNVPASPKAQPRLASANTSRNTIDKTCFG